MSTKNMYDLKKMILMHSKDKHTNNSNKTNNYSAYTHEISTQIRVWVKLAESFLDFSSQLELNHCKRPSRGTMPRLLFIFILFVQHFYHHPIIFSILLFLFSRKRLNEPFSMLGQLYWDTYLWVIASVAGARAPAHNADRIIEPLGQFVPRCHTFIRRLSAAEGERERDVGGTDCYL